MEHLAQQRMKKKQYLRRFTTTAINAWVETHKSPANTQPQKRNRLAKTRPTWSDPFVVATICTITQARQAKKDVHNPSPRLKRKAPVQAPSKASSFQSEDGCPSSFRIHWCTRARRR